MAALTISALFTLALLSNGQVPPNNLACPPHHHLWTVVADGGQWQFSDECTYAQTDFECAAMTWIGDEMPASREWTSYTLEAKMTPLWQLGYGGLAFHIQDVGNTTNSGHYYAIGLMPYFNFSFLGKFNNSMNGIELAEYYLNYSESYDIRMETIASTSSVTIRTTVNDILLGEYIDTDNPLLYGSIGIRMCDLAAQFKHICVNGC